MKTIKLNDATSALYWLYSFKGRVCAVVDFTKALDVGEETRILYSTPDTQAAANSVIEGLRQSKCVDLLIIFGAPRAPKVDSMGQDVRRAARTLAAGLGVALKERGVADALNAALECEQLDEIERLLNLPGIFPKDRGV